MSGPHDVDFEPWSPPAREPIDRFFPSSDGFRLHYLDWEGDPGAPVLLMIHGRRAHARWFDTVVAELNPRFRCVSLDLRGHGESETVGPATFVHYARDAAEFFNLFEGERRILLTHSAAGRISLFAHRDHGIRPDLWVFADCPIFRRPHHSRPEVPFKMKRYESREAAVQRFRLMPPGGSGDPALLHYIAAHSLRENEDGTWSWKFDESGTTRPFGADFPEVEELGIDTITCPSLIVYGAQSSLVSAEEAQKMSAMMQDARVVAIEGAHHHLMFDRPASFNRALLDFFDAHGDSGRITSIGGDAS